MDFIRRLAGEWGIVIGVVAGCIIIALFSIASHPSAALLPGSQTRQTAPLESSSPAGSVANSEAAKTSPAGAQSETSQVMGGDVAAGRQVFRQCQVCHSLEPGKTSIGPSLAGVIGRKAGSMPSYGYSPAMRQAHIVWDAKTLDAYLADPQKVLPGNKMPFPGLKTRQDRIDVIAYLGASSGAAAQPTD